MDFTFGSRNPLLSEMALAPFSSSPAAGAQRFPGGYFTFTSLVQTAEIWWYAAVEWAAARCRIGLEANRRFCIYGKQEKSERAIRHLLWNKSQIRLFFNTLMGSTSFNAFAKPSFFTASPDLREQFKSSGVSITRDTLVNLQIFTKADI